MDAAEARGWSRFPPAAAATLFMAAGITTAAALPPTPAILTLTGCLLGGSLLVLFLLPASYSGLRSIVGGAVCLGAGALRLLSLPDPEMPSLSVPAECTVIGTVREPPVVSARSLRILVSAEEVATPDDTMRGEVGVSCLVRHTRGSGIPLRYGIRVALRGVAVVPPARRNPGEGDARQWYRVNGIDLLMVVRGEHNVAILDSLKGNSLFRHIVYPLREEILSLVERTVGGEEGEFLKGLLIGVRSGLSPELRQAFTTAGVAHILAVSGSNVAVVAAVGLFLCSLFRCGRVLRLVGVGGLLLFYALVTGSQPPVVRATIMMFLFLLREVVQERIDPLNTLGAAALMMLFSDPRQLFDVGFLLSFNAVGAILLLSPRCEPLVRRLPGAGWIGRTLRGAARLTCVSGAATLGTAPVTALAFGHVPVIGVVSNLLVVPLSGLSVLLGLAGLAVCPFSSFLAGAYGAANRAVLQGTLAIIRVAGSPVFETMELSWFRPVHAVPYCAAILALVYRRGSAGTVFRIMLMLSLNLVLWEAPEFGTPAGRLRLTFLSVGQGDAMLAEFPGGGTVLIDTGPAGPRSDAGRDILLPYLRRRGIKNLSALVLTHSHNDHTGGAAVLLRRGRVERVFAGPEVVIPPGCTVPVERPAAGTLCSPVPGMRLLVLSAGGRSANDASLVVKLVYGSTGMLLTGDAGVLIERRLVRRYGTELRSSVLKVGHHGSATSTGEALLSLVRPDHAVVSVGLLNTFGHPDPVILQRLRSCGARVHRTDTQGALVLETDGRSVTVVDW